VFSHEWFEGIESELSSWLAHAPGHRRIRSFKSPDTLGTDMDDRTNVLLVVLDSTRARNTSLHGYDRETTPVLEAFAERSTVYTQARAPGIHSIASHVSMFTGTHVEEHEALHHTAQVDPSRSIYHELHEDLGYATGLFTNNRIVSNASNLGTHFEYQFEPDYPLAKRLENTLGNPIVESVYYHLDDAASRVAGFTRKLPGTDRLAGLTNSIGSDSSEGGFKTTHGGKFVDGFLDWESQQDGPWAACLNLMDTHSPYRPEPEFDRWSEEGDRRIQAEDQPSVREVLGGDGWERLEALEGLYDGTIRQADAIVGDLIEKLEERGELSETLLIITSDHGEAFGERSRVDPAVRLRGHKWGIHEVLTHVPLVISHPGQTEGEVVDDIVSLTDLPDLIRATVDGTREADQPLTSGDVVLSSTFRLPERKMKKYKSVDDIEQYVGPWRAVYEETDGTVRKSAQNDEHYAIVDIEGTGEATVVSREPHDRVSEVYDRLEETGVLTEQSTEIDDELEEKLEQLGYIR